MLIYSLENVSLEKITINDEILIRKVSDDIENEFLVGTELNKLNIPNFVHVRGIFDDSLLEDYIEGPTFHEFIKNEHISNYLLLSLLLRVFIALLVARNRLNFSHGDLHPENIIIRDTDDEFIEYQLEENTYIMETDGYHPVIIDFGSSTINEKRHRSSDIKTLLNEIDLPYTNFLLEKYKELNNDVDFLAYLIKEKENERKLFF